MKYNKQAAFMPALRMQGDIWQVRDPLFENALARNKPVWRIKWEELLVRRAREYVIWCKRHGRQPVPADVRDIYAFLDELSHVENIPYPSLRRYYTAIRALQLSNGYAPEASAIIASLMQHCRSRHIVRRRTPLTPGQLAKIVDHAHRIWGPNRAARDEAIILYGYGSAERPNEFIAANVEDCLFTPEGIIHRIPRSKMNPTGETPEIHQIARVPSSPLCPVAAVERWLERANITSGAMFRRIHKSDYVLEHALTPHRYGGIVAEYAAKLELVGRFGGYSTRRGWATNAQRERSRSEIGHYLRQSDPRSVNSYLDPIEMPWDQVPTAAAFV